MIWLKKLLLVISPLLVLYLLIEAQDVDPKQQFSVQAKLTFADTLANKNLDLDSIRDVIGNNKGLPERFELAAAVAYSAYPELRDVSIDMVLTQTGAPMESNFYLWTLFGSRANRKYRILLNDADNTEFDPILMRSLPFDAQVGILAHELGHVAYYHRHTLFEIGKWGLCYLKDSQFRATHERTTDLMPVYHGLGSQIYQYAYYVRNDSSCQDFYHEFGTFMDRYYMTDTELFSVLQNN